MRGMGKVGAGPWRTIRAPAATLAASATGTSDLARYSNSSSSTARSTADTGLPKMAAMPAAAPDARRTFLSSAVVRSVWPSIEPSAPPVAMIGPSAPNGPPVPMATAADNGFRKVTLGEILLSPWSTRSIASGIPCPRIAGVPRRAISPTINPPTTGTTMTSGPRPCPAGDVSANDSR